LQGLVLGFAGAAAYFVIWRTPKRISYAAAKMAFKAANLIVVGAQRELKEGLHLANQASEQVSKAFEVQKLNLVRDREKVEARLRSGLSYTSKLRSALLAFLSDLTLEEQTAGLSRTLQLQTIKSAVLELEDLEKKRTVSDRDWGAAFRTDTSSNGSART
jgi:hypothetical protein